MLHVDQVHKTYGSKTAVNGVDFTIETGTTFGLLGPNGAGKTTTMRMILGIVAPDAGRITWSGKRIDDAVRSRFGYLPEERGLYGRVSVTDQIKYFGALRGLNEPLLTRRVNQWIERLELGKYASLPCAELSKGNQQKVQVACAAVHEPEFVILDEPFSGLDPVNAEILLTVLNELKANGSTLVLSSHQLWQLESLCDAYCIIANGRNRAWGTLDALCADWPTRVLRVAPATPEVLRALLQIPNAREIKHRNAIVDVEVPAATDFAAVLRLLVPLESIVRFEVVDPSLSDVYMKAIEIEAA